MTELSWDAIGTTLIPLSGERGKGKFAIVDGDYDGEYFSRFSWYVTSIGYVARKRSLEDGPGPRVIYLHREVLRPRSGFVTDHINRDKLDNRSANLREVTQAENTRNRRQAVRSVGKGYRGVRKCKNRWQAFCSKRYIGSYETPKLAALAYDKVAYKRFGEDAVLNFPKLLTKPA